MRQHQALSINIYQSMPRRLTRAAALTDSGISNLHLPCIKTFASLLTTRLKIHTLDLLYFQRETSGHYSILYMPKV